MREKRRCGRNRILHEGEYQRADGRYRFRYIDEDGKEKNAYSWRLDKNDPMTKGKKRELSLREKEKQIEADLFDHIVTNGGNYTVLELVEKYVSLKKKRLGNSALTRCAYRMQKRGSSSFNRWMAGATAPFIPSGAFSDRLFRWRWTMT